MKKILYCDLDGVIADFDGTIKKYCHDLDTGDGMDYELRAKKVDEICETNPNIFLEIEPIKNSQKAVNILFKHYELYFLSTPMWNIPQSFTDKRIWLEDKFGELSKKRLILTHRKDLNIGDYLIDDRTRNGAGEFKGEHIHFGTKKFPGWGDVIKYLRLKDKF